MRMGWSGGWKARRGGILGLAAACLMFLPGCGSGGYSNTPGGGTTYTATFREFNVPVSGNSPGDPFPGSWPDDIAFDTDGSIWFAEHHSNEIGRFIPSGAGFVYQGYPVPTPNSEMDSIAVDSQHHLVWVPENAGNKIARLDLNTSPPQVTEIPAGTSGNPAPIPGDVTLDANGVVWIGEPYEGQSGNAALLEVQPATGLLTEFHVPTQPNGLDGITFDSAGTLWFVELVANKIGRFASGQFTEIDLPRPNVTPTNIAVDSHGLVWVSEQGPPGNAIAVYNPADTTGHPWRELPVPTPNSLPAGIALDSAGNVWFTEFNSSKIGLVPAGTSTVVDFPIPTANSGPEDIRVAPNGHVYFTEQYGNKVGEIIVPGVTPAR